MMYKVIIVFVIFVVIINTTFSNCSDIPILLKISGEFVNEYESHIPQVDFEKNLLLKHLIMSVDCVF